MEVIYHQLMNMSQRMELNHQRPIHIQELMEVANIINLKFFIHQKVIKVYQKMIVINQLLLQFKDLSLFAFKPIIQYFNSIHLELQIAKNVEQHQITVYYLSVTMPQLLHLTGQLKIVGELLGDQRDMSGYINKQHQVLEFVELLRNHIIQLIDSKLFLF